MNKLNLMYASSDMYSAITGISILSLLEKNKTVKDICFYILSDGITSKNKKKLYNTVKKFGKDIVFIDMNPYLSLMKDMKLPLYHSSALTYIKFLLNHYIPKEVKRIIYVDADTYFSNGNIEEWLNLDLQGKPCAMSQDCLHKNYKKYINMSMHKIYFNAGLIIFDMEKWRKYDCEHIILNHIKNVRAEYPLVEQDLFNIALHKYIKKINIKHNLQSQYLLYRYKDYKKIFGINNRMLSEKEFTEGVQDTIMYHFSGNAFGRPWFSDSKHPLKDEYRECWNRSEWKDNKLEDKKTPFPYRIQRFSHYHMGAVLNAFCGFWIQKIFMKLTYGI